MEELVVMGLFAEVEMGRDGVLEKMDDQIAKQNQEGCIMSAEFEAGGNNFHQRGRQHESCSQSDEIFQISSLPVPLHDDGAAENIGRGSREAEDDTCQDWIHRRGDNNISVLSSQFSVLSSQFSVLSSQFSVLSSQFSVLSSQFSVLSSQERQDHSDRVVKRKTHSLQVFLRVLCDIFAFFAVKSFSLQAKSFSEKLQSPTLKFSAANYDTRCHI